MSVVRLKAIDNLTDGAPTGDIRYFCDDGTYLYGSNESTIFRITLADYTPRDQSDELADSTDFPELTTPLIRQLHMAAGGSLLAQVRDTADNTYHVYRAVSPYTTWARVLRMGWNGSVHRVDRRWLGKSGLIDVSLSGTAALLLGEYEVSSTTDARELKIWKSEDDGATWSTWWDIQGALDANRSIRHIHGMAQHPVNGDIYVTTGDQDGHSFMIRGPDAADWSDIDLLGSTGGTFRDAIAATSGFYCKGNSQSWRGIDLLLNGTDENYAFSDGLQPAEIYRFTDDLETRTVVWTASGKPVIFGGAFRASSGIMYVTEFPNNSYTGEKSTMVRASDDGATWYDIGKITIRDGSYGVSQIEFMHTRQLANGDILVSGFGSDNVTGGSAVTIWQETDRNFEGKPEILQPVYFVSAANGNDSNDGEDAGNAWKTIASHTNAFGAGRRIEVLDGTFSDLETYDTDFWSGAGTVTDIGIESHIVFPDGEIWQANSETRFRELGAIGTGWSFRSWAKDSWAPEAWAQSAEEVEEDQPTGGWPKRRGYRDPYERARPPERKPELESDAPPEIVPSVIEIDDDRKRRTIRLAKQRRERERLQDEEISRLIAALEEMNASRRRRRIAAVLLLAA